MEELEEIGMSQDFLKQFLIKKDSGRSEREREREREPVELLRNFIIFNLVARAYFYKKIE